MREFEYKLEYPGDGTQGFNLQKYLDEKGKGGWELCYVNQGNYYWKREIEFVALHDIVKNDLLTLQGNLSEVIKGISGVTTEKDVCLAYGLLEGIQTNLTNTIELLT